MGTMKSFKGMIFVHLGGYARSKQKAIIIAIKRGTIKNKNKANIS
jgi:hypothetical protein